MKNINDLSATDSIYLFVAELIGFAKGKETCMLLDKLQFGKDCYIDNVLPSDTPKDLHNRIWVERLYKDLDEAYGCPLDLRNLQVCVDCCPEEYEWSVPIELDASASMLSITGVLLNDIGLTTLTNTVCNGTILHDAWYNHMINRPKFKEAATPRLYGSSAKASDLWSSAKMDFTVQEELEFDKVLSSGSLSVMDGFKNFLITNVSPKERMEITIWKETFYIECNHFTYEGETTSRYEIFDSKSNSIRKLHHTSTIKIPDLERFKLFFCTLLIHNIDSQIANVVAGKVSAKYGWVISIHDAFLVSPEAAKDVRIWYAEELDKLYVDRLEILSKFFKSIGITASASEEWLNIKSKTTPIENFKASPWALK